MANFKARFDTAYLQREIPMDVGVVGSAALHVGQLVTLTAAAGGVPAYISAVNQSTAASALSSATHFIAQSDVTMFSHVPVENRNYAPSDEVACTATSATTATPVKKVALYKLVNKDDVYITQM